MKFFSYLCFIAFISGSFSAKSQIIVRDSNSGKSKEINFGATIYYKLHSDSTIEIEMQADKGIITTSYDSAIVLDNDIELNISDLKYLEIENKKLKKWRGFMSPFFITGIGLLTKGVTMAVSEGTESKNEEWVPLYTSAGASVTLLSGIPFLLKNKSYDLTTGKYEIIIP